MSELKLHDIIEYNRKNRQLIFDKNLKIKLLSNITINQLSDTLSYTLHRNKISSYIIVGDYDNIIQESSNSAQDEVIIIFWELINLIDKFEYKIDTFDTKLIDDLLLKTKNEIKLVLNNLNVHKFVIFNKFSSSSFTRNNINKSTLEIIASKLNFFLEDNLPSNSKIIDTDKVLMDIGLNNSINTRDYLSSKALYTYKFFLEYSKMIFPIFNSITGGTKKVLVLDCDNTLWKGIIGEDGIDGIKIFTELQYLIKKLINQGVLIALCSKNNLEDVEEVIKNHPDFNLTLDDFIIKKVNWQNKASNIQEISQELNLGLESLVFVDDSDFEINLIKESLPDIKTYQVPKSYPRYLLLFNKIINEFYKTQVTKEDLAKLQQYKSNIERDKSKTNYSNFEEYLKSLELEITVFKNDSKHIPRISQLTMKTNQFNLTTKRYTEADINRFINSKDYIVYAFQVDDKFGSSGIVSVVIVSLAADTEIDTFLMSCRVLGRNIENKIFEIVLKDLVGSKITTLKSTYLKSAKNNQVSDLYERFGMELLESDDSNKHYYINTNDLKIDSHNYIKVKNGK